MSMHQSASPSIVSASPAILHSPTLGERKSWFTNLFHWKPHSYILCSMSDLWTTKRETRSLLESFGIYVSDGEEAGFGVLKCVLPDGIEGQRQVKFRVEFSGGTAISSSPQTALSHRFSHLSPNLNHLKSSIGASHVEPYACAIMLVQEKGSLAMFRAIHQRMREMWRLDASG
jgi:hypothetical protein